MEKQITVKQKKNLLQVASGVLLILLTFIANGFLSFLTVGFDFSKISTSAYWANFILLSTSELCVLFGMFIIQRIKDLEHSKIVNLKKEIDGDREKIYQLDRTEEAESWLREIYNYREKLILFETEIKNKHSKIRLVEPDPKSKSYEHQKKVYDKKKKIHDFCLEQLSFIKLDKERLTLMLKKTKDAGETNRLKELDKLNENPEYAFKKAKIHYREVYWTNLLSDMEDTKADSGTPFFNEKKELTKNILKYFAFGLVSSSFMSALMIPAFNSWRWETVVSIIMTAIVLLYFMARGAVLSHTIILGTYYRALEKRKTIYNQMLKDLGISKIIIEEVPEEE